MYMIYTSNQQWRTQYQKWGAALAEEDREEGQGD
jgi:hypothetical protein